MIKKKIATVKIKKKIEISQDKKKKTENSQDEKED